MRLRTWILYFGIVNACLYAALLPLWEGFDEAFHYSYVETLWQTHRFLTLGRAMVPVDVSRSFDLTPLSYMFRAWTPQATTYEQWSALAPPQKEQRRLDLIALRPEPVPSGRPNYEAQHPPLAYLILAMLDWPMSHLPLTARVLVLRLFGAVSSIVLVWFGATSLCRTLQLSEAFAGAALFTMFCSQMLYATVAHVGNDWLAVGLSAIFVASLAGFVARPARRSALSTAVWLALGLITKAYFLAFALLAFIVAAALLWRKRTRIGTVLPAALLILLVAGPWYLRNLILYRNFSGTYAAFDGVGIRQAMAAVPRIDWSAAIGFLARGSLWTGNNSFTSFSRFTLDIVLAVLFASFAAWLGRHRAIQPAEKVTFGAVLVFSLALAWDTATSFVHMKGNTPGASPWYAQVLLAPVLALAYLGMSRAKRFGRILAICTLALWTWILIATWTIKLFPLYSGAGAAPMRLHDIVNWYTHGAAAHTHDLSLLALAPAPLLYVGLLLTLALCLWLCATFLCRVLSVDSSAVCTSTEMNTSQQ